MKTFDLNARKALGHAQREKNVFYETQEFKMRIVGLNPGEGLPPCEMASHVVFLCLEGKVEVSVGTEKASLSPGQGLAAGPALFAMTSETGARLLGIQIAKA